MSRSGRIIIRLLAAAAILVLIFGVLTSGVWFPGVTPGMAAAIMINDSKFGDRAEPVAIFFGDSFISSLEEKSDNFKKINDRNSVWIAETLSKIATPKSLEVAGALYDKAYPLTFLTGAYILASANKFDVFSSSKVLDALNVDSGINRQTVNFLVIKILGMAHDKRAVEKLKPFLTGKAHSYWLQSETCRSLAQIHDQSAILALLEALPRPDFYANKEAFQALETLGAKDKALPLMIQKLGIHQADNLTEDIVKELQRVSGQKIGNNKEQWENWWKGASNEGSRN